MSEYPEHDKLSAVSNQSQAVGEFLETSGYTLCEWHAEGNNGEPRYCWKPEVEVCTQRGLPVAGREPDLFDYANDDAVDNPEFNEWPEGYYPVRGGTQTILAKHYGIDPDVLEAEKRAMLDALRSHA